MPSAMTLSDKDLLTFDEKRLPRYNRAKAQRDLKKHGNAFRYQLVMARQLEQWAEMDAVAARSPTSDKTWLAGHAAALRDVAVRLRQGDYLPGGPLHDDTVAD
jgi:hypothetical protein